MKRPSHRSPERDRNRASSSHASDQRRPRRRPESDAENDQSEKDGAKKKYDNRGSFRGPLKAEPKPAGPAEPDGLAARRAAIDVVTMVEGEHTLDDALGFCHSFVDLEGSDRAFARALIAVMLRRRGSIDEAIGQYLSRPFPKRSRKAMHILRCAAAQSLFLDMPAHAAVSTAVELAKAYRETEGLAGVINAIARKVATNGQSIVAKLPSRVDTASWLWRSWERSYGPAAANAFAKVHRLQPPIDLSFKPDEDLDKWAERIGADRVGAGSLRLRGEPTITHLPGFAQGAWWVQDAAAALPAKLFGDVKGLVAYDLCAAPGGKTMQLAAAGAKTTAVDQSSARLKRLTANLERTHLKADVVQSDVLQFRPAGKADVILLDAPCTATGTIRRHPDVMWSKTQDQVDALKDIQSAMIDHAVSLLKPGGVLVYCVCSLQPEEAERQAEAALARHANLSLAPVSPEELGELSEAATKSGTVRTTPAMLADKGGVDGFFAARFKLAS